MATNTKTNSLVKLEKNCLLFRLIKIVYPQDKNYKTPSGVRHFMSMETLDSQIAFYKMKDPNNDLRAAGCKSGFKERKRKGGKELWNDGRFPRKKFLYLIRKQHIVSLMKRMDFRWKIIVGTLTKSCIKRLENFRLFTDLSTKSGRRVWKNRLEIYWL